MLSGGQVTDEEAESLLRRLDLASNLGFLFFFFLSVFRNKFTSVGIWCRPFSLHWHCKGSRILLGFLCSMSFFFV